MGHTRPQGRRPPGACLFGIETEYSFASFVTGRVLGHERLAALIRAARDLVPHLPCTHEEDVFTANGSRVCIDGTHPEVATPECASPEEAVIYARAGDLLLARARRAIEAQKRGMKVLLWKGNVDHRSNATWGSHENYLHTAPPAAIPAQLTSHLVTRIIYTGAGGFDNLAAAPCYVISPRVFHLKNPISSGSTHSRGIIHTRHRPLARAPYHRLHLLAGESLWSQTAEYLRIGTTALLIAQIEAGRKPQAGLDLASPVTAIARVAADVTCATKLDLAPSGALSAIDIQRRLLHSVEEDLGADHLPAWAAQVCRRWAAVLDQLEASPAQLIGTLDWPTKLALLQRRCEHAGIAWTFTGEAAPGRTHSARKRQADANDLARLRGADIHFTRLDEQGIFATLDRQGVLAHRLVSDEVIEHAIHRPPSTPRATIRARYIKRYAGANRPISCYWDQLVNHEEQVALDLSDPFCSARRHWRPLSTLSRSLGTLPHVSLEPIEQAIANRAPREALRAMRVLLRGAQPVSLGICRYGVILLETLVPTVPVPALRHGAATAGPVLEALYAQCTHERNAVLNERAAELLYRWYEGRGRYACARRVLEDMFVQAQARGDRTASGSLANNVGYEYLLQGDWPAGGTWFRRALELFATDGSARNIANTTANLLECRFARTDPADWNALAPELDSTHRALRDSGGWRVRKTYRLLARLAEHRNRLRLARRWARMAVKASSGIETQLRAWDAAYLQSLEERIREIPLDNAGSLTRE